MTKRIMSGAHDWTGQSTPGGLQVDRIASRTPLKWFVSCPRCSSHWTEPHQSVSYAKCRNVSCGVTGNPRSAQARPGAQEAVRSRDSESARRFRNEEAEREEQERVAAEERQKVERTQRAEEQRQAVRDRQRAFIAEGVATGIDPMFQIDPNTLSGQIAVPRAEVAAWNAEQARIFKATCPDYVRFQSAATFDALVGYLKRNANLVLVSAWQWQKAFERLKELGLIHESPVPAPEPKPAPRPVFVDVNHAIERSGPETFTGRDWQTGKDREFTQREVDRMSADEFKRSFKVIPSVAGLFTEMKAQREVQ